MEPTAEWSVYIARCADGSLYTGVAKDVRARLSAHNAGRGAAYTRPRRPVRLVHREDGLTRAQALTREARIKSLPRPAKLALLQAIGRALAVAALLLTAGRALAVPVFTPEGQVLFSSAAPQSFASVPPGVAPAYPIRMYFIRQDAGIEVGSATSGDGVNWTEEAPAGRLSINTLPSVSASSITAASVLPLSGGAGFRMMYSMLSTTGLYSIRGATSVDGLTWTNDTTGSVISAGGAFVGSPRVVALPTAGDWRMYFIQNTDGGVDLPSRQIFTAFSSDQGHTWGAQSLVLAQNAYEVGASQLTDGRVRLYFTQHLGGQTLATVINSAISGDSNGTSFSIESGARVSTATASGSLSFAVPVRSTDSFRWRLYYDFLNPGVSTGSVFSALTGAPAPVSVSPASLLNTTSTGTITINGEIFSTPCPTFVLRTGGQPDITPSSVVCVNDEQITASIDVLGLVPGMRDLVITNADGTTTTLPQAFLVDFPGGSVSMVGNLISPRSGNTTTTITVSIFNSGSVTARLFTVDGRHVATLFDGGHSAGVFPLTWNGTSATGTPVASGLYILHVTGPKLDTKQKIVVIR